MLAVGDNIVLEAVVDRQSKFVTAEAVVNEVGRFDLTASSSGAAYGTLM